MTDIVELIDSLNGLQWNRDNTQFVSLRIPLKKKRAPEDKVREHASAAAAKRAMYAQGEVGEENVSTRMEADSSGEMLDSDDDVFLAKEGRV